MNLPQSGCESEADPGERPGPRGRRPDALESPVVAGEYRRRPDLAPRPEITEGGPCRLPLPDRRANGSRSPVIVSTVADGPSRPKEFTPAL